MKRVTRVIVIQGDDEWVDQTLSNAKVAPDRSYHTPNGRGEIIEVKRTTEAEAKEEEEEE